LDYTQPAFAGVLRALVRHGHAAGEVAEAERRVEAAVAADPEQAVFHEIRGLHRELGGAAESAREAYERALELAPASAAALAGLARLADGVDPSEAVALFDRAAAADPSDAEPRIGAARALLESGQREDARRRLLALLESHPLEPEPPADLVSLDLASVQVDRRTLAWAERASRLVFSPEAYEQLSVVYARLGEAEASERAADQAQRLREQPRLAPRRAPLQDEPAPKG
jgi:tetratricopeptide (TPR) repeat protein